MKSSTAMHDIVSLLPIPREIAPPCISKLAAIADNSKLKQSMQLLVSNKLKQHKLLDLPPVAASKAAKTSANQFWKKSAAEAVTLRQPGTTRPPDQKTGETPEKNKHKGGP